MDSIQGSYMAIKSSKAPVPLSASADPLQKQIDDLKGTVFFLQNALACTLNALPRIQQDMAMKALAGAARAGGPDAGAYSQALAWLGSRIRK